MPVSHFFEGIEEALSIKPLGFGNAESFLDLYSDFNIFNLPYESQREGLDLLNAYFSLKDSKLQESLLNLAKTLSESKK